MKKRKSIKIKLISLFLIMGIIPSLLIMFIMYFGVTSNLEQQTGSNLKILAMETSLRVDMYIQNKIENVMKYASYSTLKRIYFPGGTPEMASEFIRSLFKFDADLYNISLLNMDKKLLFSYRPNLMLNDNMNKFYNDVEKLDAHNYLISLQTRKSDNKDIFQLDIITPLSSDLNQKKIGLMVTSFDLSNLIKLIENIPVSGSYYIALINNQGYIISDTRIDRDNIKIPETMLKLFNNRQNDWVMGFDDSEKNDSVFGYAKVLKFSSNSAGNDSLMIYVSKNKEEAFRPVLFLVIKLLAFSVAVIFFILIIFMFRIETISKPIISLKKGAEMIGEGNFDMVLFVPTGDELEDLASSFNKMGKNLKLSRETLEEQNRKLIELNNVKNNFISMVSHELRTPLMIIKEALSQIIEGLKGPVLEDQKEFLNMAFRNTARLNQIVQDLLTISKIETGKMKFNRNKTDIVTLLQNEINDYKIKCDERKITIGAEYECPSYEVYCDKDKVQIIFVNLLGNAIKFTKNEGRIDVIFYVLSNEIKIGVIDNGPGIPPDSLEKIFERFVRLNAQPLSGIPSTGLGLAIAKEMVEMHGGKIWAESDGTNGSRFYFTLPLFKGEEYLQIFLNDRISEIQEKNIDLSIFNIRLKASESINRQKHSLRSLFEEIQKINFKQFFEPLEIIPLESELELFIFVISDSKSAEVISSKIRQLTDELTENLKEEQTVSIITDYATLNVHGKTYNEIRKYFAKIK